MNKKLMFVIPGMRQGGAERVMSILVNEAIRRSYHVSLLMVLSGDVYYELDSNISIISVPELLSKKNKKSSSYNRITEMRTQIKVIKPELIVSFMTTMNMYSVVASAGLSIPVIGSERNAPGKERSSCIRTVLLALCYRMIDGMVFQTEEAKALFSKSVTKNAVTIANPVSKGLPKWVSENTSHKCVAVGRLEKQKNYVVLLDAFKKFRMEYPDYILEIYGDGSLRSELEARVRNENMIGSVVFMGNRSNVHECIKNATMFVITSDFEGIPNALLESLAMGIPSVATDCPCGGVRMLIKDGINGYLVPVGDVSAVYNRMCDVIDNHEKSVGMSRQSVLDMKKYSEDNICEQFFSYFNCIMSKLGRER